MWVCKSAERSSTPCNRWFHKPPWLAIPQAAAGWPYHRQLPAPRVSLPSCCPNSCVILFPYHVLVFCWHAQNCQQWLQLLLARAAGEGWPPRSLYFHTDKDQGFSWQGFTAVPTVEEGLLGNWVICPRVEAVATLIKQSCTWCQGQIAEGSLGQRHCQPLAYLCLEGKAVIKGHPDHSICVTQGLACRKYGFALPWPFTAHHPPVPLGDVTTASIIMVLRIRMCGSAPALLDDIWPGDMIIIIPNCLDTLNKDWKVAGRHTVVDSRRWHCSRRVQIFKNHAKYCKS